MKKHFKHLMLAIGTLGVFYVAYFLLFIGYWIVSNIVKEKIAEQKFWQEVETIPQIEVIKYKPWDGSSMATINLKDKGEVRFWYTWQGRINFEAVGEYRTSFPCEFTLTGEPFSTALSLNKDSAFIPLFGVEINSLHDLVTHYDTVLSTLHEYQATHKKIQVTQLFRSKKAVCQFQVI